MYNTDLPTRAELPTSAQLLRSTAIAIVSAALILVTIVLPSEYAIDPTGIGRALRLTEMGEIKTQLAAEAEKDRANSATPAPAQANPAQPGLPSSDKRSSLFDTIFANLVISSASAQQPIVLAQAAKPRTDETVITLKPNEGVEYKLSVKAGAKVNYSWTVEGGVVNADLHGTSPDGGKEKSFKMTRGAANDEGALSIEVDGVQGWFFRNRGSSEVKIILKTNGAYSDIKRMV